MSNELEDHEWSDQVVSAYPKQNVVVFDLYEHELVITKKDVIALSKHFKITPNDLINDK
jgi:hypothetical protein